MIEFSEVKKIIEMPLCSPIHTYGRIRANHEIMPSMLLCFSLSPHSNAISINGNSMPLNSFCYIPSESIGHKHEVFFDRCLNSPYLIHKSQDYYFLGKIEGIINPPFNGDKFQNPLDSYLYDEVSVSAGSESLNQIKSYFIKGHYANDVKIIQKNSEDFHNLEGFEKLRAFKSLGGNNRIETINLDDELLILEIWIKPHADFDNLNNTTWMMNRVLGIGLAMNFDKLFYAYKQIPFRKEQE